MTTTSRLLLLLIALAVPAASFAAGPLLIFDPPTRTPWAYAPGNVNGYTDLGAMGPTLTNAEADAIVAFSLGQWTGVASSYFSSTVAGDFGSIGLPDITGANAGLVVGTNNGGGIHVMYDNDGSIISGFFGAPAGVLGIASPDFGSAGTLTESWAVLNGTSVDPSDAVGTYFAGVFTHELGHSINLAHVQTNGAITFFGDATGPSGCGLPYGGAPSISNLETMYPFIDPSFGSVGQQMSIVDNLDDQVSLSDIYPTGGYPGNRATIDGTVYLADGVTEVTGVNVIARNVANPWVDCVSHLSGDFTQGSLGDDGFYEFQGLTPGADYVIYIDGIVAGGFSTPAAGVPAAAEEFHNGVSESGDPGIDSRCASTTVSAGAGGTTTADVIINEPFVLLGDDSFTEVQLPFTFPFCDVAYNSVFINANGNLTFGAGDADYSATVSEFLNGPPRISGVWTDLSPQLGEVTASGNATEFTIAFNAVPEWNTTNVNTFEFRLRPNGTYDVDYDRIDATAALAGRTPGGGAANPGGSDLSALAQPITGTTVYQNFAAGWDLDFTNLLYATCGDSCVANTPPTAVCQNVSVNGSGAGCLVAVTPGQVDFGSFDPDGDPLNFVLSPPGPYAEGVTNVQLVVTDPCGDFDICSASITVTCSMGPIKDVGPASIAFNVAPGDTACEKVTIRNTGDENLIINSINGCAAAPFWTDLTGLVTTIPAGDSTCFLLCYSSATPMSSDSCTVTVDTNDGSCDVTASVGAILAADRPGALGAGLVLSPALPNPFTSATRIRFALGEDTPVRLDVFDFQGRRLRTLVDGQLFTAGEHEVRWDGMDARGRPVASGIYLIRVASDQESKTTRLVRTR